MVENTYDIFTDTHSETQKSVEDLFLLLNAKRQKVGNNVFACVRVFVCKIPCEQLNKF